MELREKIIEAAEHVILTKGLARTTTKDIAKTAECSEGSLYNNFDNKEEIFLNVLRRQLQNLMSVMGSLPQRQGKATVRHNLYKVAAAALEDFYHSMPFMASVFAEPGLLLRLREGFMMGNEGPHRANETLTDYLHEEQLLGRIEKNIEARAAADMLLGSCFQYAFQMKFSDHDMTEERKHEFITGVMNTLLHDGTI